MRALKVAVVVMAVLIVVGVGVLAALIVRRVAEVPSGTVRSVLDEPAGTRIVGMAAWPTDRLALQLQGGGPDRVVMLDMRSGRVVGMAGLAR
jgi:hypothetical protein